MRGIFDYKQISRPGELENGGHVAGITGIVHYDDRLGLSRHHSINTSAAYVPIVERLHIGEDRSRTAVPYRIGSGDKGERRTNDFVSRSDTKAHESDMKSSRATAHGHRM